MLLSRRHIRGVMLQDNQLWYCASSVLADTQNQPQSFEQGFKEIRPWYA